MRFNKEIFTEENKAYYLNLLWHLLKFLLSGLPSFLLAIPLNYFMVEYLALSKPLSYLITLFVQVSINFFMIRRFVFKSRKETSMPKQYFQFMTGIAFFRFLDWGLYTILVSLTSVYYIFIQIFNVIIFSLFKFFFSKHIIEK